MTVHEGSLRITARSRMAPIKAPLQAAVLATPGTGKTELMLLAAADFGAALAEKRVHILVPDNTLSRELLERARKILPPEANPRLHRGRMDTVVRDEPPCHPSMHATVQLVEALGASAAELVCPTCPFAETCEWHAQNRDDAPGVVIMPHAYATLPAGGRCDAAVIDEDIVLSLHRAVPVLVSRLDPSEHPKLLTGPRGWALGNTLELNARFDLHDAGRKLWDASHGGTRVPTLPALRAAGLTPQAAKLAKSIEYGRAEGIKAALEVAFKESRDLDQIRKLTAKAVRDYGDAWKHAKLWQSLEVQLQLPDDARETLNGWRIEERPNEHGGSDRLFVVGYRARLKFEDKPVLALDATGDRSLLTLALPYFSRVVQVAADAPHAHVIQAIDTKNGKRALVGNGTDDDRREGESAARRRRVVEVAEALAVGRETGLISYKGVEESPEVRNAPEHIIPGHYGLLRGQNKWKGVDVLLVAGRMMPRGADVEDIAGGLFFDQPEAIVQGGFIGDGEGSYLMRSGEHVPARVEMHSSPVAEKIRRQITEAELVQAVGRARGVQRTAEEPVLVAVLTSTPVPGLLVDEIVEFDDLVPNSIELNFARTGVYLNNARHAFSAFDGLFKTEHAAKQAYKRERLGTFPYKKYIKGNVPNLARVEYQCAGVGNKKASALFDLSRVTDPRAWLTQRLGPVAHFEINSSTPEAENDNVPLTQTAKPNKAELLLAELIPANQRAELRTLAANTSPDLLAKLTPHDFASWRRFAKKSGLVSAADLKEARTFWERHGMHPDRERRAVTHFLNKHPRVRALAALIFETKPPAINCLSGVDKDHSTEQAA
ncbi:hypothetical protein [Pseudaminobacter sp. NGMCC 1.201702]|uniref:hypothetical protein n=1 Tax=Pseudaminobacter sp. NGMCC 1.201702 TaxID=3391825 RepID=UPI0039F09C91